jgi:membrane protease YdiL (CAAX protease family)
MQGDEVAPHSPVPGPAVSRHTVVGFVLVIALVDVVANAVIAGAAQLALKLVIIAAMLWWAHSHVRLSWDQLGLGRGQVGSGVRLGLLAAVVVGAVISVAVALPATRSFFATSSVDTDSTLRHVLEPLLVIPLGTVVFEETIFRGVLLALLLCRSSQRVAVIVSAVIFGCWHLVPAISAADGKGVASAIGTILGTVAVTTAAGIVFAWLRLRSGSLAAPILAHIATNSLAYTAATST